MVCVDDDDGSGKKRTEDNNNITSLSLSSFHSSVLSQEVKRSITSMDWAGSFPSVIITVLLGCVVYLLVSYFSSTKTTSKKRDSLLICGPSGGGKTVLAYRLCVDKTPNTITSMRPSVLEYSPVKLPVVDFPGHPRLRALLYSSYLDSARHILFLVDASNVQGQAREAAEFIYDLFTNPSIDQVSKFHVVCNKNDLGNARPAPRIKLTLQQELEKIKKTRTSLEEADDSSFVPLGREGKPFSFDQDSPVDVSFYSLSAKKDDMESIIESIGL